jgi:hypothetical protein
LRPADFKSAASADFAIRAWAADLRLSRSCQLGILYFPPGAGGHAPGGSDAPGAFQFIVIESRPGRLSILSAPSRVILAAPILPTFRERARDMLRMRE